ncbi:MAG: hypothetical protein LBS85_00185 [Clostridiales Family XIII bacterium]|nr:hypothetical protein [Clostridiales Family XIII bacterium]
MTAQAQNIVKQMKSMSDSEIEFVWDFLRKRRNEALLKTVDLKLEESMDAESLNESEVKARLEKLGIA